MPPSSAGEVFSRALFVYNFLFRINTTFSTFFESTYTRSVSHKMPGMFSCHSMYGIFYLIFFLLSDTRWCSTLPVAAPTAGSGGGGGGKPRVVPNSAGEMLRPRAAYFIPVCFYLALPFFLLRVYVYTCRGYVPGIIGAAKSCVYVRPTRCTRPWASWVYDEMIKSV